jgi:hypothetical protein
MASRITKSAAKPTRLTAAKSAEPFWLRPAKVVTEFCELPGATFYGEISVDSIDSAQQLQDIRAEYEQDGHAPTLIQELTRFGFPDTNIAAALLNPATITSCGYGPPPVGPTVTLRASLI